mmetsp:Transcript_3346/g.8489  ORF Transcript_3346/g.8489 Transcript_3346/m.8489 type:complete len:100 (+) Transcript_3346:1098-1397(+)
MAELRPKCTCSPADHLDGTHHMLLLTAGAVSTELDTKKRTLSNKLMIMWAGAVLMTASGRMLADVHWFSDTLGGACLGMFLVSLGTVAVKPIKAMQKDE